MIKKRKGTIQRLRQRECQSEITFYIHISILNTIPFPPYPKESDDLQRLPRYLLMAIDST